MKRVFTILMGVYLFSSCASKENKEIKVVKKVSVNTRHELPDVIPNRSLSLEIEGMMCEMGCGSTIRKELKLTGGVHTVSYDFKDGREKNIATITFNKDKISVDKIMELISNLNDKQFKVTNPKTTEIVNDNACNYSNCDLNSQSSEGDLSSSQMTTESSSFETPNLLKLFTRFFLN